MVGRERDVAKLGASLAPQSIDYASICDSQEPRAEWTAGIIGVADGVDRQQHVLYRVLDVARVLEAAHRE